MPTAKEIESRVAVNPSAQARLAAVQTVLVDLVTRLCGDGELDPSEATTTLIRMAAIDAIVAVLHENNDALGQSPAWPPPRYRLPADRSGRAKDLFMEGLGELGVALNFYEDGEPAEIFVEKHGDSSALAVLLDALAVTVSIGLQHGIPWDLLEEKLRGWRFSPDGATKDEDSELRFVSSPLDYIFKWAGKCVRRSRLQRQHQGE